MSTYVAVKIAFGSFIRYDFLFHSNILQLIKRDGVIICQQLQFKQK